MALIQTVRGLDQTGPGENGETLETLWRALAKYSDGRFHAAEESALRWLLKSMNGPSPAAETLRRYPLTWTILDRVFLRIPLFSLAKSLADRRFVAVLQQTLKDISKPSQQEPGSPSAAKRKRSRDPRYTLDDLRGTDACLATGQAVFTLLRSLLSRLDDEAAGSKGSRGRIGAEHLKSLFSTSATEAAALASAALMLCNLLLSSGDSHEIEIVEGQHDWIKTVSTIWDLHLQGIEDALEVATHLFKPAVSILAKVEAFPQHGLTTTPSEALATRWSSDLQQFMHRNFLLPARTAFLRQQDFETVTRALDVAASQARHAAPGLYFLAAGAPDPENERDMRRENATWMRKVFEAVEYMIRRLPDRNALMEHILGQAITKSVHVDVEDLRKMYRTYGFKDGDGDTDWSLVAKAAVCNPDIFHSSPADDDSLLKDVCQRSIREGEAHDEHRAISELLGALQKSFCTRRQFSGFLKLWFGQLCALEEKDMSSKSPWFEMGRKPGSPSTLIESELSPSLVLEVIEWLRGQEPLSHPRALCAFANSLAQGLGTEAFIDAVGTKLFDLVSPVSSSDSTALKWRVVSKAVAWVPRDARSHIWVQVKDELSKILRKKPIKSAETFEALKCCYQIWDSMSCDEAVADEPAAVVEKFTARLAEPIASEEVLGTDSASAFDVDTSTRVEYDEQIALQQYLAWYLLGSSRFLKLFWSRTGQLPPALDAALTHKETNTNGLRALWDALMRNDVNINDSRLSKNLVDRLIAALDASDQEKGGKGWPDKQAQLWIASLSSIPGEAFSRQQREQIMTILEHRRAGMKASRMQVSIEGWKLVLDLSTKMMSRPTFYEGLQFSSLVEVADALSEFHHGKSTDVEALLEQIQRYFALASATIRQMAENRDERSTKYFAESAEFVSKCDVGGLDRASRVAPFRVTLLKALAAELSRSSTLPLSPDLSQQLEGARKVLAQSVASAVGEFAGISKLLSERDVTADLSLFAATDAAPLIDDALVVDNLSSSGQLRPSVIRKLDRRSKEAMNAGDLRGWKLQIFLHRYLAGELEDACPTKMIRLSELPAKSREGLLKEYVGAVTKEMGLPERAHYLAQLVREFTGDCDTDGQILAIDHVVHQLIEQTDAHGKADDVDLAAAHGELTFSLLRKSPNTSHVCRVLHALLEIKPQAMGQWNIDLTLGTVSKLVSVSAEGTSSSAPFPWLCRLVGVIIRRHRLRLEGHYHLLLATMQALLRHLVNAAPDDTLDRASWAHMYARLVSLVCEPTAGSVSRAQHQSALDTATDVAKRSAGRHMYLVLMQYVKLQLEAKKVGREVREVLEPAMNTIFDITPPEVRKILNDAMDASGRAILREMYKQYVKFGKWNGV